MAKLNDIVNFLNRELDVKKIKDDSKNGLQVKGSNKVNKIAFGVDACMELFEKTKEKKCDMAIVHHGLLWKKQKNFGDIKKKRIEFLKKNKISLYAVHLPLDKDIKYGNNIEIAKLIGLKKIKPFAKYDGVKIGYYGYKNTTINELIKISKSKVNKKTIIHDFGKNKIKKIGVVSGSAPEIVLQCKKLKIDAFVSGEPRHSYFHINKENRINVFYCGHYKTETYGVKALMNPLKQKFNIETVFIDTPTNL